MTPLETILICLIIITLMSEFFRLFSIPRVVSQVGAGIIVGIPAVSHLISADKSMFLIKFLADMGVILLLYFVGLKMNFSQFKKSFSSASLISLFNTALPLVLGFMLSKYAFGLSSSVSVIIGVCLSVSAVAIALDMLEEYKKLRTKLGALIISAGSVDDIFEIFLITGVLTFVETTVKKTAILHLFEGIGLFAILTLIFRFWIIPLIIRHIESQPEHAELFTGALITTLLMAVLADILGVGALIGALFSGMIIRQILFKEAGHRPWERTEITHTIHTIAFGFVVPFFFFYVGMQTNIFAIWQNLLFGITITILAIFGTVIGSATGYYIMNHNWKEGWVVGWAMNAKGDTELVVASLALSAGAISNAVFSSLIFMAVVSTLISPLVLKKIIKKI